MEKDIWLKLVAFEVATSSKRTMRTVNINIEDYCKDETYAYAFEGDNYKNFEPKDIAVSIEAFVEKREEERKKQEEIDDANARQKRRERWAKIQEELETTPAKVYPDKSLEFQLGIYIGEDITRNYMPCLSIDGGTNNPIEVSEEDVIAYNKVDNAISYDVPNVGETKAWKDYIAFRQMLYKKYLPEKIDCWVNRISSITNMEDLKRGIEVALWDSDVCSYESNVIDITHHDIMWRSIITLYRDKTKL